MSEDLVRHGLIDEMLRHIADPAFDFDDAARSLTPVELGELCRLLRERALRRHSAERLG